MIYYRIFSQASGAGGGGHWGEETCVYKAALALLRSPMKLLLPLQVALVSLSPSLSLSLFLFCYPQFIPAVSGDQIFDWTFSPVLEGRAITASSTDNPTVERGKLCLSLSLSVRPSVCLSVYLSVSLSVSVSHSIYFRCETILLFIPLMLRLGCKHRNSSNDVRARSLSRLSKWGQAKAIQRDYDRRTRTRLLQLISLFFFSRSLDLHRSPPRLTAKETLDRVVHFDDFTFILLLIALGDSKIACSITIN